MAQERKSPSRVSAWIVLAIVSSLVIAIGCGGGGGGGTTTGTSATGSSATGTSATGTSATGTSATGTSATGTTSTGTTSTGTTGTITGVLPTNVIIFGTSSTDSNNNLQTSVNYVNPDGTNLDGGSANPYESYDAHIGLATPNPQKAAFAFAYTADPTNVVYDIYSNATLTTTGATRLTSVGFSSVNSLQFSPDGTKIVFVASVGSDLTASSLYVMNADGTGIHTLDSADDCYVASDGVHIAYTRFDTVNQVGQIYLVNIDGTNLHAITSNTDDHFGVQLSKDVTRFAWSEAPTGGSYDIYTSAIDGSQLTKITSLNGDNGLTPTFSNDGTTVAYVDNASDTTKTGIYSVGINGLGTATVTLNPSTNSGIFWTSSTGILSRHHTAPMFGRSIHIAKMKRLGKWHGGGQ